MRGFQTTQATDFDCPLCGAEILCGDEDGIFFCAATGVDFDLDDLEGEGGCKICHGTGLTFQLDEHGVCRWEQCETKFEEHEEAKS